MIDLEVAHVADSDHLPLVRSDPSSHQKSLGLERRGHLSPIAVLRRPKH